MHSKKLYMHDIIQWLISLFTPKPMPPTPTPPVPTPPAPPKYLWDTRERVIHSIRLICDEELLTLEQKNTLCATIHCESGFNTKAICRNKDVNGVLRSTDWGICQWNDYWHGKEITPDQSMNNPEKAVRLMCKYWKQNLRKQWVCYSKGLYKQYL